MRAPNYICGAPKTNKKIIRQINIISYFYIKIIGKVKNFFQESLHSLTRDDQIILMDKITKKIIFAFGDRELELESENLISSLLLIGNTNILIPKRTFSDFTCLSYPDCHSPD